MPRIPEALTHKRRVLVGQLWLRGYSERQIAEMVCTEARKPTSQLKGCENTTHVTVHHDVEACREEWQKRIYDKLDAKRADQVASLNDIAHQAFVDMATQPAYLRPQYLRIALEAQEKIAKILGTMAPVKLAGEDGEPLIPPVVQFHMPDGTVIVPSRHTTEEPVPEKATDNDGHSE